MIDKNELRRTFLNIRKNLSPEEIKTFSSEVVENIKKNPVYQSAKTVGLFHPIHNEVNLLSLLEDKSKRFCFPKVINQETLDMDFYEVGNEFSQGVFNIYEPDGTKIEKTEIDLILVPGLIFSRNGHRIGYGKGYFDVYLKDYFGMKIGACYHFQVIDYIESSITDVPLQRIITNQEDICIQQLS